MFSGSLLREVGYTVKATVVILSLSLIYIYIYIYIFEKLTFKLHFAAPLLSFSLSHSHLVTML